VGLALALVLLAGCVRGPPEGPQAEAAGALPPRAPVELWVDSTAREAGEGSRGRPFKGLKEALAVSASSLRIHVGRGLYAGPFTLPPGTVLEGTGEVVLYAEGEGGVLQAPGGAQLSGLSVQGGDTGVEAEGTLGLSRVRFSGQRRVAVRLVSGQVTVKGSTFQASVSETVGLLLEAGTRAEVVDTEFLGPYARALAARGPQTVQVSHSRFEGPVTGLHVVGGDAGVRFSTFQGGRGPALFLARAALSVEGVSVKGHEYALQVREVKPLSVRDFASVGAERAGLALMQSQGVLEDVQVVDSGPLGALQLLESNLEVRRLRVHRPECFGVTARGGTLSLEEALLTEVRDVGGQSGNAVELRKAKVRLNGLTVLKADGLCVLAAEDSQVTLTDAWLSQCRWAGVLAETLARVQGAEVTVRRSPGSAIALPGDGEVSLYRLVSEKNTEGAVWADCAQGARGTLRGLRDDSPPRPWPPCVQRDVQQATGH